VYSPFRFRFATFVYSTVTLLSFNARSSADEGMWLFNSPPTTQLQEKYQFTATEAWLQHMQKSSVRFNSGGSGSFVSADGLVITNHHVASGNLEQFSDSEHNYIRDGFYAKTLAEEKRCYDLELNVLESIEDVTDRVNGAVRAGLAAQEAFQARQKVIAEIEKESEEKTGLRSDVVTLYGGGSYQLYRYKRYTDIRLVFAPEQQIAFYGGDPDNFEYPRFALDICLFRVYENGRPARIENFLKFNTKGPADKELTFVSGHPGNTERQLTVATFKDLRDRDLRFQLDWLARNEVLLDAWGKRSIENERRANGLLFAIRNNRKRYNGMLASLLDPDFFRARVDEEENFRRWLDTQPQFKPALDAYDQIESAQKEIAKNAPLYWYLEGNRGRSQGFNARAFAGDLFKIARGLVRSVAERSKPNGERLAEYVDSNKTSLELMLFSEAPIYDDLEQVRLAGALTDFATGLGGDNPLVERVLAGKSPHDRAFELISKSTVKDVNVRRRLYEGGTSAIANSSDPLIQLAHDVDDDARAVRKIFDEQTEIQRQAYAEIAGAKFAREGTGRYPDATFTLRLSYAPVAGYEEDGAAVPPFTDFAGLYQRAAEHGNKPPYDLPKRWINKKDRLDPKTHFNFVSTADIVGGNSGSPVVNRAGEFVGIIFDGNIQSLALDYAYTDKQSRAVSVASSGIYEALTKVYDVEPLVKELTSGKRPAGVKE
jgi:Peptidase S46